MTITGYAKLVVARGASTQVELPAVLDGFGVTSSQALAQLDQHWRARLSADPQSQVKFAAECERLRRAGGAV